MKNSFLLIIIFLSSVSAYAGPWGNDFGLSYNAASAGMGAGTYANPTSTSDAVFGNPATLTKYRNQDWGVTFGAAYANIDFDLTHDGSVTGAPFSASSDTKDFLIPNVSVVRSINDKIVVGGGLQITAGLGADFRTDTPLSPSISYVAFGNNFAIASRLNEHWSVGASVTMGFALMDVGPVQSAGTVNDIGLRGALGVAYHRDNLSLSLHYTSPLAFDFDNAFLVTATEFGDLPLEQPQEVVLGLSYRFKPDWDLQMAVMNKAWGSADAYEDIWRDQTVFTAGIEHTRGKWSYRAGIGTTSDLRRENLGSSFGGNTSLGFSGMTIPLSPPITEFLQASLAPSFWDHSVSFGLGYEFDQTARVDFFLSSVFGDEENISAMNQTDVDIVNVGASLSWRF